MTLSGKARHNLVCTSLPGLFVCASKPFLWEAPLKYREKARAALELGCSKEGDKGKEREKHRKGEREETEGIGSFSGD